MAKEIEHLRLRERMSSPKLARLSAEMPGSKSKSALMAVGDASVFLDPPGEETPEKAAPDLDEQKQMMSLAVEYLRRVIPRLPNFYARRLTRSFEEVWTPGDEKGTHNPGVLHHVGEFKATVYYRGGNEVVHEHGAAANGLITRGTFGPVLSTVIIDAAHSATEWSRWEEGPNGPMAVFRFRVPKKESHYQISENRLSVMGPTAYHGEIGIDPSSGTILRLVLRADPDPGSSMERADIMVEYGSVAIGGKTYTCPVRSVAYSLGALDLPATFGAWQREAARLNDVVFDSYHVFRSEIQILPYTPQ